MEYYNKHYIRTDTNNNIIDGWSDGPHPDKDTTDAICINEQGGYQFRLFPGEDDILNPPNPPLQDENGIYLYRYRDGQIIIKTSNEIQAEIDALPELKPQPEPIALLGQAVTDLEIRDIEKEILLTDLEIEIAELKSNLEVKNFG